MQTLKDNGLDSIEIDDVPPIQFDSFPKDFLVNMVFTLPMTFMAKEGQSLVMYGDVKEKMTLEVVMLEKDKLVSPPSTNSN